MLTINDASTKLSRRQLLSIGSLGLGGMSLVSLLGVRASAASLREAVRNKSVIFLFQQGGRVNLKHGIQSPTPIRAYELFAM